MDENKIAKIVVDRCLKSILKLAGMKLGLLTNFNVELIKDGITRIVNKL